MISLISTSLLSKILLGGLAGFLFGSVYFISLNYAIECLLKGKFPVGLIFQLIRFIAIGLGLFMLARWDVIALISAIVGILIARHIILSQLTVIENE